MVLVLFGETFISLGNGRIIKVAGTGCTGQNMFGLVHNNDCYLGLCGYFYFMGCQNLEKTKCN